MGTRNVTSCLAAFLSCLFLLTTSAEAAPTALTYQGRILKSDGTPLEYSNVSFIFQIVDPSGQCVIYQERVTGINMANSKGVFDVPIGKGGVNYPLGGGFSILEAFNNSRTFTCGSCVGYDCSDGTSNYTPVSSDGRLLRTQFHDGSAWKLISPDAVVRSVPYSAYALSAQKLGTNVASDFVLKTGVPTCAANEFLSWNGTALVCAPVSGASGGTVTSVSSSNSYITVTNATSTPALTLNVGTTAGTVAAGNDSRFSDARVPTGSAGGDLSGTYPNPSVGKIQGVAVSAAAPTSAQFLVYNGTTQYAPVSMSGDATMSATGAVTLKNTGTAGTYTKVTTDAQGRVTSGTTLSATDIPALDWSKITTGKPTTLSGYGITDAIQNAGATPSVQTGTVASRPAAGTAGRLYIGSDDNTIYRDTGSAWVKIGDGTGSSGVTTVSASAPLTSSGGASPNITISQATSTTDGYLSSTDWTTFNNKLGTSSTFAGDVSGTSSTTSVDKIKGKSVVPGAYSAGQTLKYDGTNWVNAVLGFSDLSGSASTSQLPTIPVSKGGTGVTSLTANRLLASDGTGSTVTTFNCGIGQLLTFDASGVMGCTNYASSSLFTNGGNSFAGAATLGTNDAYDLNFETGGSTRMTVTSSGNVGIGTTTPSVKLSVNGQVSLGTGNSLDVANISNIVYAFGDTNTYTSGGGGSNRAYLFGYNNTVNNGGSGSRTTTILGNGNSSGVSSIVVGSGVTNTISNAVVLGYGAPTVNILSTGNVGIGTSSPASKLHVAGTTRIEDTAVPLIFNETDQGAVAGKYWRIPVDGTNLRFDADQAGDGTFSTYRTPLALTAAGKVGIGTITPTAHLNVTTSTGYAALMLGNDGGSNNNHMTHETDGSFVIYNGTFGAGVALMTISSVGNTWVKGTFTQSSDVRLKKDIHTLETELDKVLQIRPVSYYWRDQETNDKKKQIGLIAQEVEKIYPEVVQDNRNGYKSVAYSNLISPLIAAFKEFYHKWLEHSEKVDREIASLKEENSQLKLTTEQTRAELEKIKQDNATKDKALEEMKARLERLESKLGK